MITEDQKPLVFIECKVNETQVSPHLKYLKNKFPSAPAYQLTYNAKKDFQTAEGIRVVDAHKGLREIFERYCNN